MAELLKVREITIDTMQYKDFATKEEELKVMRFYQNDLNSAKLLINITHDKVVTDFSMATKVQIAFLKPDGKRVFQDVQNVNQMQGKYYVVLSTQTLIAYGNVIAQLRLTFPNNKVIETCKFVFAVDESIMSDEAMASTNEFPVIQKAIEAGEKLEGVDIDVIIAAGELAKGALPKTGGTMTGPITMSNSAKVTFKNADSSGEVDFAVASDGRLWITDKKANKTVATIKDGILNVPSNLNVPGETNLYKKTDIYGNWLTSNGAAKSLTSTPDLNTVTTSGIYGGSNLLNAPAPSMYFYVEVIQYSDAKYILQRATSLAGGGSTNQATWVRRRENNVWGPWERILDSKGGTMTGMFALANTRGLEFLTPSNKFTIATSTSESSPDRLYMFDSVNQKTVFDYNANNGGLFILNGDTNLLKKTGDTFTGNLSFNRPSATSYQQLLFQTNGVGDINIGQNSTGKFVMYDQAANSQIWEYDKAAKSFNVTAPKTNIVTKEKDGRADLTLTANGENFNGQIGPIADRVGNTVTFRAGIRRRVDGSGPVVTTLPVNMRPTMSLIQVMPANDGTLARVTIQVNGDVQLESAGATSIIGKDVYMVMTFAVN